MCPPCIDYKLKCVFCQHIPLNLWGNNYIMISEITYNKNEEIKYYHAWLIYHQFNLDSKLEYPAKKQEMGLTFFVNVFFFMYLTTKNVALHMHFN